MRCKRAATVLTLALAVAGPPLPVLAQGAGGDHVIATIGDGSGQRHGRGRGRDAPAAAAAAPSLPSRPQEVWPRLDAGAVLCQSRDELTARARLLEAATPGAAELPQGCHLVRGLTGVTVVDRAPPGATQVKLRDSGEVGWTDAYLPERRPGG